MSGSAETGVAPRRAAVEAVAGVVLHGRSLARELPALEAGLGAADAALAHELAYGSLRWYRRLQAVVNALLSRPLRPRDRILEPLLVVGLYQLEHTRVPPHAAVSATVAVTSALGRRRAAGLVNGCLRRFQRERERLLARADRDPAVAAALPEWLDAAIRSDWPEARDAVAAACLARPPMTLRVNRRRTTREAYAARLVAAGITARPLQGLAEALVLDAPVAVNALPGFAEGEVSVQDGAAQFAAGLLAPAAGDRVLDACAAPGGKTAHLLERGEDLSVLALDSDAGRLERVGGTLARLGLTARLCAGDASHPETWWDGGRFQRILLDAPCSGTGVIRRHPDIKWLRRAADIPRLAGTQAALLRALWPLLAPGGRLVYATCSLLHAENEAVASAFAAGTADARVVAPGLPAGRATGVGHQLLPGEGGMDGFYYACFDKSPCAGG
ncbi:Ribosomal RNA small subunit methyltransferase B [wastewater metagenome]|uniref:16S rRNA (cytosine(967)-C(5))-methyltransferase n=2 Tax=unclassified sequences TaxID=12908 RepID=A0A5B8R7K6_9ZZZZ|nr:16S rRNA (cytosine(967)-C(5))-methyltransferase RsmB [Arhodomonas sp. KWT]QEA03998.1 ribosomal RNA small subunit methyltransferase B [uncultured organism]